MLVAVTTIVISYLSGSFWVGRLWYRRAVTKGIADQPEEPFTEGWVAFYFLLAGVVGLFWPIHLVALGARLGVAKEVRKLESARAEMGRV